MALEPSPRSIAAGSPLRPAGYLLATVDQSVEERSGGDDHGAGPDGASVAERDYSAEGVDPRPPEAVRLTCCVEVRGPWWRGG